MSAVAYQNHIEIGIDVTSHPKQVDLAHMKLDDQRLTGMTISNVSLPRFIGLAQNMRYLIVITKQMMSPRCSTLMDY